MTNDDMTPDRMTGEWHPDVQFATFSPNADGAPVQTVTLHPGDPLDVATVDLWPLREEVLDRAGQRGALVGPAYVHKGPQFLDELGLMLRFDDGELGVFLPNELLVPGATS